MNSTLKIIQPFGPVIGSTQITDKVINKVNSFVDKEIIGNSDKAKTLDHGHKLAGEVSQEIRLPKETIEGDVFNFLYSLTGAYIKYATNKEISKFQIIDVWVVRQFRNEYNPPHFHSGHISGVGYLMLPEGFGEIIQKTKKSTSHGEINFIHGTKQFLSKGQVVRKPKIGDFYIFPNYLYHSVNPFYQDGERRSLSFNAIIDQKIYDVYGHIEQ